MKAFDLSIDDIGSAVSEYCRRTDYIELAYLYGSIAHGTSNKLSDVDIALKIEEGREIEVSEYGLAAEIIGDLIGELGTMDVDVIVLNDVSPFLKREAVIRGVLIYAKSDSVALQYRMRVLGEYLDFKLFDKYRLKASGKV